MIIDPYVVGEGVIAPDPERLLPLQNFPPRDNLPSLKRVLGMFAYYAKWIPQFADKICPLAHKHFPPGIEAMNAFELLKEELAKATLNAEFEFFYFIFLLLLLLLLF